MLGRDCFIVFGTCPGAPIVQQSDPIKFGTLPTCSIRGKSLKFVQISRVLIIIVSFLGSPQESRLSGVWTVPLN